MSSSTDTLGVGLVGFGTAGRFFHAPVIQAVPGLRLAAVAQRTGDSARSACPGAALVRTLDELLTRDEIRLVVIATPNASHAALATRALEAGRHVVVDKPVAPSSADARALSLTAARTNRVLGVFHNRRFDGDFLTVQSLLDTGTCGRIVSFESRFDRYRAQPRPGAWRERAAEPASGVLFDLGPHLIDQALVLFGIPDAITADVRVERDAAEADDAFDVTLHYPRLRARLGATMLAAAPGPRFTIRGTEATFVKWGLDPQEEALRAGRVPGSAGWGEERDERWGVLTGPSDSGATSERVPTIPGDYRRYYENVRDAILGTAPLVVTPEQATTVIRLIELAILSSREGRTVPVSSGGPEGPPARRA